MSPDKGGNRSGVDDPVLLKACHGKGFTTLLWNEKSPARIGGGMLLFAVIHALDFVLFV
jgi:hypothetical protein